MIELHCETDFVAKTAQFMKGVEVILKSIHENDALSANINSLKEPDSLEMLQREIKLIESLDSGLTS